MIKGTSVGQAYKNQGAALDIKVNKTFMVPVDHLITEEGFNVRELDQEHIAAIAEAYREGKLMPAIVIKTTTVGFKIIDGHHRLSAAKLAGVQRLECKEFVGTEAEQIAFMVSSSQTRNLNPIERAHAYRRMMGLGMTKDEIAKAVARSRADVDNHLLMLEAGDAVIEAIQAGEISATSVHKEMRKSGAAAQDKIMNAVTEARSSGKRATLRKFTKKHQHRAMELVKTIPNIPTELQELLDLWLADAATPDKQELTNDQTGDSNTAQ